MHRLLRHQRRASRGQALLEFALVLPILALLLVVAIDFGRAFFGWVSLTNAARIGANYAGYSPDIMTRPSDRSEYVDLISDAVTGCNLTPSSMSDPSYDPTYEDLDGDGKSNGWGDHVIVNITCELDLITPLAEAIFADQVTMHAEAVFPIREGTFAGPGPVGGVTPPTPCTLKLIPDLMNRTLDGARQKWIDEGFLAANFTAGPTEATGDWLVRIQTFDPDAPVQACADPTGQKVHVETVAPPPCPAGQAQVPDLIGDLVSEAKTEWATGFSGAFLPSNALDDKTVLTQRTSPVTSPPINGCAPVTATVTITYGDPPPEPCDVPNMIGLTFAEASAGWRAADFKTELGLKTGNSVGTVIEQQPTHPGVVSCEVAGKVKVHK